MSLHPEILFHFTNMEGFFNIRAYIHYFLC